jgi:4-amino-4-deoxy-L-arabinose transferase-like glycosyltransferase
VDFRSRFEPRRAWWLLLVIPSALSLWLRPLVPPVETRYINVAWEMWSQGHFLVPVLNGASYSDKPPLFFWLIHIGWAAFGVNEWWPRVLPTLLAVLDTALAASLAGRLWPEGGRRECATWILAGTIGWIVYGLALLFDMLLAAFVLAGLIALVEAARTGRRRWHVLYGASIAGGILAKGPVAFLHLLPVAMLAPWWLPPGADRARWFARTALAVAGGVVLAGAWVVPAALLGGDAYREKILWKQTAGRVTDSFAHAKPWWFFIGFFPLLALPWIAWPRAWSGLRTLLRSGDRGTRFLFAGLVPAFLGFSAISGKQVHYLVPWLPATSLLAAAGVTTTASSLQAVRRVAVAVGVLAAAAVIAFSVSSLGRSYDVEAAAPVVAAAAGRGAALASTSGYNGELGFYARLATPVLNVGVDGVPAWCTAHPGGLVIDRRGGLHAPYARAREVYSARFRRDALKLWECDGVERHAGRGT